MVDQQFSQNEEETVVVIAHEGWRTCDYLCDKVVILKLHCL